MRGTLVAIVVAVALGMALLWLGQRRMIYFPFGQAASAERSGLPGAENVSFTTDDGVTLHGWFVPAASIPARFTVLMFNGNAGHRGHRAPLAGALARHGIATLLFDYRGYGGNSGRPSENGLALDARAARQYLWTRTDVDSTRTVYFGESLGAAVALRLATESPPFALVLRSPFTSLADMGRLHYPMLPVRLMLRDHYLSLERAPALTCPTLVIAGERDSIIPIENSRRLFDAIAAPKRFVAIPRADHNDEALFDGDQLLQSLLEFLASLERR
ncbi:MAG TPA: alpha/beta hydrolase [Gemmatimonadaceae bacterium]